MTQVFAQSELNLNPQDKYEFPDLEGQDLKKDQILMPDNFDKNGWNDMTDQLAFATSKKQNERFQQEFPDLQAEPDGPSRLDFTKTKSNKLEKHKPKTTNNFNNPFED